MDCFIEASYTGELEEVNVGNFRDVNKMSHVFEVSWLVAKCQEFFVSYLGNLNRESSYDDILFAVEEAVFVMSALKKRNFLELVVPKLNSTFYFISQRDIIINQFLSNLGTIDKYQLDACIAIARSDVHVLVQNLIVHIKIGPKNRLDENMRYLLKNLDLNACYRMKPDVHEKLFSALKEMSLSETVDFQLIINLFERRSLEKIHAPIVCRVYGKYFDLDLKDMFDKLLKNHAVTNLYSLFEVLWLRLSYWNENLENDIIDKIVDIKTECGWCKLDHKFIDNFVNGPNSNQSYNKFHNLVKGCDNLVNKEGAQSTYAIVHEYAGTQFLQEVLFKDHTFLFHLPNGAFAGKPFILMLKSMESLNPESFFMSFYAADDIITRSEHGKEDSFRLPNLHFALEITFAGKVPTIYPISWCGYPIRNKKMTYWEWGYLRSSPTRPDDMLPGNEGHRPWLNCNKGIYRLICFHVT